MPFKHVELKRYHVLSSSNEFVSWSSCCFVEFKQMEEESWHHCELKDQSTCLLFQSPSSNGTVQLEYIHTFKYATFLKGIKRSKVSGTTFSICGRAVAMAVWSKYTGALPLYLNFSLFCVQCLTSDFLRSRTSGSVSKWVSPCWSRCFGPTNTSALLFWCSEALESAELLKIPENDISINILMKWGWKWMLLANEGLAMFSFPIT